DRFLAQERVELAGRHVVEAVALDGVADIDRMADPVAALGSGNVEPAPEVEVGKAARADPDQRAVELLDASNRAIPTDVEAFRRGVVGLGEVEVSHSAADDPDRGEGTVPAVPPVPGELLGEGRSDEARLQPQRCSD